MSDDNLPIKIECIAKHCNAQLPSRAQDANGWDLYSVEQAVIKPGERKRINTGVVINFPNRKIYGVFQPRSGLADRSGIDVLAGFIDWNYRGTLQVILQNHGKDVLVVDVGHRIAQMEVPYEIIEEVEFVWGNTIEQTERNDGGFGSTGK